MLRNLRLLLSKYSRRLLWREMLACLFLIIGIYFLRMQRHELGAIGPYLHQAKTPWLLLSGMVTLVYIFMQSAMYVYSFAALGAHLNWVQALELFLKRNLLGVFIPGGGISALAYVPSGIKRSVDRTIIIHQASGLFALAGMLSTFLVTAPVLLMGLDKFHKGESLAALMTASSLMLMALFLYHRIKKGKLHMSWLSGTFPRFTSQLVAFSRAQVVRGRFGLALSHSLGVEACGIIHIYLAMLAIGAPASLQTAAFVYVISCLLMMASPFLKGLGAVELSIVYVLGQYNYSPAQALAIAIIYRAFEFWLPLAFGVLSFLMKGRQLFMRIAPAIAIFLLGLVNILSVVTPPIRERLHLVRSFLPSEAIRFTNVAVLFIGLGLLVTAAYLVRGLRNAWWIALIISFISIWGHLFKAFDYEEAIIATAVFTCLLFTRRHYKWKSSRRRVSSGIRVALLSFAAVLIYGFVGFYFLEKKHFGMDFTWEQSLLYSARGFFLLDWGPLHPLTHAGRDFVYTFRFMGLLSWLYLFYTLVSPYLKLPETTPWAKEKARDLLQRYGTSPVDFFKLAPDKQIFISPKYEGFVSYSISGPFAIVLEEPVCNKEHKEDILQEFEQHCNCLGLKTAFYRVDEKSVAYFDRMHKKKILIGQEALLELQSFELAGRCRKSLRNGLNALQKKGFETRHCPAPHSPIFIAQLKAVSDEWLRTHGKKELRFSQGVFDSSLIQHQDVIACFNEAGKPVAFLNIIPDFSPGECTYDLIRKTADAPGSCMDALIIELVRHARGQGLQYVNLGMVPMAGLGQSGNPAEKILVLASRRIKGFRRFQGLRLFKEKYSSRWLNKYLVYENDFDLLQLPVALKKVMKETKPSL